MTCSTGTCPKPARIALVILTVAAAAATFAMTESCSLPGLPVPASQSAASGPAAPAALPRSLAPGIDMTPASYVLAGTGPGGLAFSRSTSSLSAVIPGLRAGQWTVTVSARNASGTTIGRGSGVVTVSPGSPAILSVTVTPVQGNGTLSLGVSWSPADVQSPAIDALLYPAAGGSLPVAFALGQGQATSSVTIPSGYYALSVRLLDGGVAVMGAVESARIVAGQATTGRFDFSRVNKPAGTAAAVVPATGAPSSAGQAVTASIGPVVSASTAARALFGSGSLAVTITPRMNDPVLVTLAGQATEIGTGLPMTVSSTLPQNLPNTVVFWCLNGVPTTTGPTYTFNDSSAPLAPGFYRLDAVAFAPDGGREGTATAAFQVFEVSRVRLAWNPNGAPAVAGYRMYVGSSSGTYGAPLDTGLATVFSVPNLLRGHTYFFAVTAYGAAGLESPKSNEVSYTVP